MQPPEGGELLDLYVAYRHVVRAKVRAIEATEDELSETHRAAAIVRAKQHLSLAADRLESACGLQGSQRR